MTEHPSIAHALAAFQAEMPTVAKGKTATVPTKSGGQYRYTYADLADVAAAASPLLAAHGLSFTCTPEWVDGPGWSLVGRLLHTSGEALSGRLPIGGHSPQEIGSALTYARRYLLGCLTGIVTDDDDDGATAEQAAKRPPARKPRAAAPAATKAMGDKTRAHLFALFGQKGITDRDRQIRGIAKIIGHPIESRGELTEAEARAVIEVVERYPDPEPDPATGEVPMVPPAEYDPSKEPEGWK